MDIFKNIPIYVSYRDLYSQFLMGREIHSCLTHKFSNDVMFVGLNDKTKFMYHQMNKLYVVLETLSELFNDNPLYDCDISVVDDEYVPDIVDGVVKEKYVGYFNKLHRCLKTTIDNIKSCKKGISQELIIERCSAEYSVGAANPTDCIIGDYSSDYNDDYFKEVCNQEEVKMLIKCNTVYDVMSYDIGNLTVTLDDATGLNIGDKVEMGGTS